MNWPNDGKPCAPREIPERLERIIRQSPPPRLRYEGLLRDECGHVIGTVQRQQRRPDGPWNSNGRQG